MIMAPFKNGRWDSNVINKVMRIDSHQHFWTYSADEFGWIDSSMSSLMRDFLPAHLAPLLQSQSLDGSVSVQARQSYQETDFLLELAHEHEFIKGVVGWANLQDPAVDMQLERLALNPFLKGVRHVIHDEPDDNFMLRPAFIDGISRLASHSLTYDILIFSKHLPCTCDFVKHFPNQLFVVDHIAKPRIREAEVEPWRSHLAELARHENVFCKLSGMITEAHWSSWQPDDLSLYMDSVLEFFGPDRVMFGSDWPVCSVAGSYARVAGLVESFIASLSTDEQAAIMGSSAVTFYNL